MAVLCLILRSGSLLGQSDGPRTVLKVNPLSIFVSTLNVKAERRLNQRFSAQLGFHIGSPRLGYKADTLPHGIHYFFTGLTPELRYYIAFNRNPVPKGMYVGVFGRWIYVQQRYASFGAAPEQLTPYSGVAFLKRQVVGIGFLLGYQLIFKNGFVLDLFTGPEYSSSSTKRTFVCSNCSGDEQPLGRPGLSFDGILLRGGLGLGFAF